MKKEGRMKRKELFFFPSKLDSLSPFYCHKRLVQFQASHLNQIFDTWLELLCSSLSLCSARGSQN